MNRQELNAQERRRRIREDYFQGSSGRRSQQFDGPDLDWTDGSYQTYGDEARWKNAVRADHYNNDHFGYGNRERTWYKHIDISDAFPNGNLGKGPKGYTRSDQRIYEEVCELLREDPYVDASEIEVNVQDGIVTLSGTVESKVMKREAEWVADHVAGVEDIINLVRTVGEARPEANENREGALDANPVLRREDVEGQEQQ